MKRLLLLLAACSPPAVPDAGPGDAGPVDAGPPVQQHCVASSCPVNGTWQVLFNGVSANPVCRPVDDQARFTSDGGTLCMLRAVDGGSDGGCGFVFVLRTQTDSGITLVDTWDMHQADAGHIYGTWTTNVTGAVMCTATYMIHAVDQ